MLFALSQKAFFILMLLISEVYVSECRLRRYVDLLPQCLQKSTKLFSNHNFRKAQNELATIPGISIWKQSASSAVPWAGTFYNTDWGANLYNISGKPIVYAVVFKVNSENIHNSLATNDYMHQTDPIDLRTDWKKHVIRYRSSSLHELKDKLLKTHYQSKDVSEENLKLQTFTFIRDPLEHFISGLVEAYFRGLGYGPHPQLNGQKKLNEFKKEVLNHQVDMNLTKVLVNGLIFGQDVSFIKQKLKQWKHFYPQFFSVRKWQPKYIGYLDNFEHDWIRMQSELNVNMEYVNEMSHLTQGSGDIFGFKKMLQQLFAEDPKYMRAMCHLLIRDYICLGFELPAPCVDMYDTYDVDFNAILASNAYNE
jgi:hypothetical protein